MRVNDPAGRAWEVRRQLIRLPRWRGFGRPTLDASDGVVAGSGGGGLGELVVGIAVVVTMVLAVAFVWPLVVLLIELAAGAVLIAVRLSIGRWTVVAETVGERNSWSVRGRARSAAFAADVADALRTGAGLPGGGSFESRPSVQLDEAELEARPSSGHVRVLGPRPRQ
jgi:hypothetical protein